LAETYGVMVYQEQVMQIASVLAGYSLGEGDVLRRAMGKKDREEMARQREKFLSGCAKKGIHGATAALIFDKIEKFASYGFNKSHAAAYAYLSYATAYFKANYPGEWMAALMTCDRDDTTKLAKLIGEARTMHLHMLPPDINQAGSEFAATKEGIRFAMSGIKGVGQAVVDEILAERGRGGSFKTLYDFVCRADKSKIGKRVIELLIEAGSFDVMGWSRDAMKLSLDRMYSEALRDQKEATLGILNLFSLIDAPKNLFQDPPEVLQPSTKEALLQREKELLGFYLTGHPMDRYQKILSRLSCVPFSELSTLSDNAVVRVAFVVEEVETKISNKTQKKFAVLTVSDGLERLEMPIWSEMYEEKGALLKENQLLYAILQMERRGGSLSFSCRYLNELAAVDEAELRACDEVYDKLVRSAKHGEPKWKTAKEKASPAAEKEIISLLRIRLDADQVRLSHVLQLKQIFRSHPGKSPVELHFQSHNKKLGTVAVESTWGVKMSPELLQQIRA
ncbi:MAG TPA: DNA polymerase III subunit alpha, partial [Chlamydiales bacterium]